MPYFQVDDQFHSHPKTAKAGNAAIGLWVRLGSYCSAYKTDGKIEKSVAKLYGKPREFRSLLEANLLQDADEFWVMPDYLDHNYSSTEIEQKRQKARERKRKQRETANADDENVTRDSRVSPNPQAKPSQAKPTQDSDITAAAAKPVSEQDQPSPSLTYDDLPPAAAAAVEIFTAKRVLDEKPKHLLPFIKAVRNGTVDQNGAQMIKKLKAEPDMTVNQLCRLEFDMGPGDLFTALESLQNRGVELPVTVTP